MKVGEWAGLFGIGLVAGLAGTAAITLSQTLEMKARGRSPSPAPAKAVEKVFGLRPDDERAEARLATLAHWGYGTSWGVFRTLACALGLKGWPASLAHAVALESTALVMLPGIGVAPPVSEWGAEAIAIEFGHHLVYAAAAGWTFERLAAQWLPEAAPRWEALAAGALAWAGARRALGARRRHRLGLKLRERFAAVPGVAAPGLVDRAWLLADAARGGRLAIAR